MQIVFLGPPGVGKGTQAKEAAASLGVPHISSGDMLREAIKAETSTGRKAKGYVESGQLVPDSLMVEMIEERIAQPDCVRGFVLDGFPRTLPQAEALDVMLAAKGRPVDIVIYLDADENLLLERLSGRRLCRSCGANFHVKFMPSASGDRCDRCGGELYQRPDDKPETIRERLKVYNAQTAALVKYYKDRGLLRCISSSGSVEQVAKEIQNALATASSHRV